MQHQPGRVDRTFVPGITMQGVGIRAAHNRFQDCPASAIRHDGNDLVQLNTTRWSAWCWKAKTRAGTDTYGNPTFRGNVLRYNSIAYIGPRGSRTATPFRAGIRLDDSICGTLVYGNIFFHAAQGFGAINMNGGRDNIIDNNIFAECEKAITGNYDANTLAKGGTVSHECDSSPSLCSVTAGSPTQALTSTPEARPRQPTVSKTHGQQLH